MRDFWVEHLNRVEQFEPKGSYLEANYKKGVIACDVMGTLLTVDHHSEDTRDISERELPLNQSLIDFLLKLQKAGWEVVVFTHDIFPRKVRVDRESRNNSNSYERAFKRTGLSDIFTIESKRDLDNYENVYFDLLIDDMYYMDLELAKNEFIINNFITPQKVISKNKKTKEDVTYMSHGSINFWNPLDPEVIAFLEMASKPDYVVAGPKPQSSLIVHPHNSGINGYNPSIEQCEGQQLIITL